MTKHTLELLRARTHQLVWTGTRSELKQWELAHEILTLLGPDTEVRKVTAPMVQELCIARWKAAGHAHTTINRKLAVLRRMLTVALEHGWIHNVPVVRRLPMRVKADGKKEGRRERYLTPEEQDRMFGLLADKHRQLSEFLVDTGLRVGEALGLRVRDVDLLNGRVTVRASKNGGARVVPLTQAARRAIILRLGQPADWLWPDISHSSFCKDFARTRARCGLDKEVVPHVLRHTFATRLVQRGCPIHSVCGLLGHSSIEMTMRYAHHAPEAVDKARDLLEGA